MRLVNDLKRYASKLTDAEHEITRLKQKIDRQKRRYARSKT